MPDPNLYWIVYRGMTFRVLYYDGVSWGPRAKAQTYSYRDAVNLRRLHWDRPGYTIEPTTTSAEVIRG